MKVLLALLGVFLIFIGRIFTFTAAKAAWRNEGEGTVMDKLKARPPLLARYRFGQFQYVLGVTVFAACFFL